MSHFDYRVIPAPLRGEKAKEARTPADRYAAALTAELNRMAAEGWEYVRADVLPSEERSGLTGRSTVFHNLLVFRRPVQAPASPLRTPQPEYPAAASPARAPEPLPDLPQAAAPQPSRLPTAVAPDPVAASADATPPAPREAPHPT